MFESGTYRGYLKDTVTSEARSGSLQVVLTFSVRNVWNGTAWDPVPEQERSLYLSLTDNAWEFTEAKLNALGFNGDFEAPEFSPAVRTDGIDLTCAREPYNGKTVERWELARWRKDIEPAATDKLHRLNARWKATTTHRPGPPSSTPTSAPPPVSPPTSESGSRETAWQALVDAENGKKTQEERTDLWRKLIAERGKPEDQFTPEDWRIVADAAAVPF